MTDTPETDTPESDKAKIAFTSLFASDDAYWVPFIVARKLERERDEAQERADTMFAKHVDIIDQTRNERDEARNEILGWKNKWDCAIDMAARAGNALDEMTLRWERTNDALFNERALAELDSSSPSDETACSVCKDAIKRLGGHKESRLDGDTGLAAATMRSYEALLRVCDLLEAWKSTLTSRNGITWNALETGDTLRLKESIDELEAAIRPPQVQ